MQTTVRTCKEWQSLAQNWATSKDTTFLGVYGNPGLSKTFTLRQVLGEKARVIRCPGVKGTTPCHGHTHDAGIYG